MGSRRRPELAPPNGGSVRRETCGYAARAVPRTRGTGEPFGGRFPWCGCGCRIEAQGSAGGLLPRRPDAGGGVLVRAPGRDAPGRAGPRLPHVRHCGYRAVLRGVLRKGRGPELVLLTEAPAHAP